MRYFIGLLFFLSTIIAQVTDKNFKDETGDGVSVIVFTSEWQEQDLDEDILKGVKGYQDARIITVKSEDAKKVAKKLRLRNFPSIALFHDGSKQEVWKGDMDGEVDCSASDIKKAIDEIFAGDVF
jgi:thioredoxin-like negative regulator of GroEL|tara:strand:- start:318 stop:692 length:375 start_codon:yes stop_codon:yes gene_type:complete